jgi:hypothetical protein
MRAFALVCVGLAGLGICRADELAAVTGLVTDPHGASVPGATIVITNIGTNVESTGVTNNAGIYWLPSLQPGIYRINLWKDGFKSLLKSGIELHVQDVVSINFELQVGSVSETVTVNANSEHMETDNPAVGILVNHDFVENMPLNGRSLQDLIALAPGAVTTSDGSGLFSVNGQRNNSNYYTVDGVSANVGGSFSAQASAGTLPAQTVLGTTQSLVSVDSLQEFKIQTAGYTAEYGRQPGGQIQLTTRSGTNAIHGSLFDYLRNDALDANDWFLNEQGIPKLKERQNDFGGTVGGPLQIRHLYNGRDRTFYFFSYEGLRLTEPQFSGIQDVPTADLRQFAAVGVRPFLDSLPLPNMSGHLTNGDQCAASAGHSFSCTGQWSAGYSSPITLDSVSLRIDEIISQRFGLFGRYARTASQRSTDIPFNGNQSSNTTSAWTVGTTLKLTSRLLDELRFNYTSSDSSFSTAPTAFQGAVPYPKSLVIPPQYASGDTSAAGPVFIILPNANFFQMPSYGSRTSAQNQYNLVNSVSWLHGRQAFKFGGDYRRLASPINPFLYLSLFELFSLPEVQQGFSSQTFVEANEKARPVFDNLSLYAQDHITLSLRLTLDLGVRWEFDPAPGASDGLYPLALTTGDLATAQLAPRGTSQYHNIYHDVAPRVGFAYNAMSSKTHSTVIRGGVGVFYDTGQSEGVMGYSSYPFSVLRGPITVSLPAPAASIAPPSLNIPLITPYPNISGISDPHLATPYTEQWNLTVDQGILPKNTLTLSYVGNVGRKLLFQGAYSNLSSINPAFTSLSFISNAASSSYNALQLQDQGYVAPGMQLVASYTWAHGIDNASIDNGFAAPIRGNSAYDVRQILNMAINYKIPGSKYSPLLRGLTSGWSLNTRFATQTGYPLDITQSFTFLPDGSEVGIRPDIVPGVPTYLHNVPGVLGGWQLNRAAFACVPTTILNSCSGTPLRQGDLGRNFIHGPNFWNLNAALERDFVLHERLNLAFRVEAFNIFNHPNAVSITTNLSSSTFGQPNSNMTTIGVPNPLYGTGGPRSLQVLLKLAF